MLLSEIKQLIKHVKEVGILSYQNTESFLSMSANDIGKLLATANHYYYNTNTSVMSDAMYDMFRDRLEEISPHHPLCKQVGAIIPPSQDKIKLPFWMGSMNKIKPGQEKKMKSWFQQNKSNEYVYSDKLDGVSCLYYLCYEKGTYIRKLFTRGDGTYGRDISHLLEFCALPVIDVKTFFLKHNVFCCRGEIIMSKKVFNDNYKESNATARNLVSGLVNAKHSNQQLAKHVDIIMYELIEPYNMPLVEQLHFLDALKFRVVSYTLIKAQPMEKDIQQHLAQRKQDSNYEIDGIIVSHNRLYYRNTSGNPHYSFAYKMLFDDQIERSTVTRVIWSASKDGYLKPRIQIEPIIIGGTKITYTTGFNAKYIKENRIGPGAVVEMIRSGDVIPYITRVISPTNLDINQLMPTGEYKFEWSETGVDIILLNPDTNPTVVVKNITRFMKKTNMKGLQEASIKKMVVNGYDTIDKIMNMTIDDLVTIDGFKYKMSHKIYNNIHNVIDHPIALETLMEASNIFGRGFGKERCKKIIKQYPTILDDDDTIDETMICAIDGFSHKMAKKFMNGLQHFKHFLDKNHFIIHTGELKPNSNSKSKSNLFENHRFVFTGFRDKLLEQYIIDNGGVISSQVNAKTTAIIRKTDKTNTSKIKKGEQFQIPIFTLSEFIKEYHIL